MNRRSRRDQIKRYGKSAQKEIRAYQVDAVLEVVELLDSGGVILKMPQGTGKSLVSQMVARLRLDEARVRRMKTLVITPTIELREQYCRLGEWFGQSAGRSPGRYIGQLDESKSQRANFKEMIGDYSLIVTTPKFLANRLEHMAEFWTSIDLCVLDEVDLWSIAPIDQDDVRVHRHMETILPELKRRKIPILGLTASRLTRSTRELLAGYDCAQTWSVPPDAIGNYLPRTRIVLVPCFDEVLTRRSNALSDVIKEAEQQLRSALGDFHTDIHKLVRQHCRRPSSPGFGLAVRVQGLWGRRTRLHEDFDEAGAGLRVMSGKQEALVSILERDKGVVVYAREVSIVEHLATLRPKQRTIGFAHAASHRENIGKLQRGELDTLVMTRALGLRGLDFPNARAMVLYSPKHDLKVMDQEMCRIRGQRHHRPTKPVYILYYANTYEEEKVGDVVRKLTGEILDGGVARYSKTTQPPKVTSKKNRRRG